MTEANKKSVKGVAIIIIVMGLFWLFTTHVSDDSFLKKIVGALMLGALIASAIYYTPIGNPIKRLYRKFKEKK